MNLTTRPSGWFVAIGDHVSLPKLRIRFRGFSSLRRDSSSAEVRKAFLEGRLCDLDWSASGVAELVSCLPQNASLIEQLEGIVDLRFGVAARSARNLLMKTVAPLYRLLFARSEAVLSETIEALTPSDFRLCLKHLEYHEEGSAATLQNIVRGGVELVERECSRHEVVGTLRSLTGCPSDRLAMIAQAILITCPMESIAQRSIREALLRVGTSNDMEMTALLAERLRTIPAVELWRAFAGEDAMATQVFEQLLVELHSDESWEPVKLAVHMLDAAPAVVLLWSERTLASHLEQSLTFDNQGVCSAKSAERVVRS